VSATSTPTSATKFNDSNLLKGTFANADMQVSVEQLGTWSRTV